MNSTRLRKVMVALAAVALAITGAPASAQEAPAFEIVDLGGLGATPPSLSTSTTTAP